MTRAEEYSIKYADEQLAIIDKELSETSYSRHTKMGVRIFNGSDIEQAAMNGYEQAEKETIKRIKELLKVRIVERTERCQEDWSNRQKDRVNIRNDEDGDIILVLEKLGEE